MADNYGLLDHEEEVNEFELEDDDDHKPEFLSAIEVEERRQRIQEAFDEWWNATDRSRISFLRTILPLNLKGDLQDYKTSPLHVAAELADHLKMQSILICGVTPDEVALKTSETALHKATTAQGVQFLVEAGFGLEKINVVNMTPILVASYNDRLEVLEQLIACGGNVNARLYHGEEYITATGLVSEISLLRCLLNAGCEVTTACFLRQVCINNVHIVKELLALGVSDIHTSSPKGQTALHIACKRRYRKFDDCEKRLLMAHLLVENGIKTNAIDNDGKTALDLLDRDNHLNNELRSLLETQMFLENSNYGFKRTI